MNFLMFAVCLTSVSCSVNRLMPEVNPVKPTPTVTPRPGDLDACGRAGLRIEELNCRRADGTPRWLTPKGASFAEFCRAAIEDGRSPQPECLAKITDCSQIAAAQKEGVPCAF